jgi:hypothetical protein
MDFFASQNARRAGRCIYCGRSSGKLSREHVVPYGLNGPWVLLDASCAACARVTAQFERTVLQELWPMARHILGLQTRRKRDAKQPWPIVIERGDRQEEVLVAPDQCPLYLPSPRLRSLRDPSTSEDPDPMLEFRHIAGPTLQQTGSSHDAEFVGARLRYRPHDFRRLLAKVGVCAVVYSLGLEPLADSALPAAIVDEASTFDSIVGAWAGKPVNPSGGGLHEMRVKTTGRDLHVIVRLFAQFGAPEYHVDLGAANPAFVDSERWPFRA